MEGGTRVQKIIADAGFCSRREAERHIADGAVRVNGRVVGPGAHALPTDTIKVGRRVVTPGADRKVVVLMNKPKGIVSSNADPHHDRTVFDLLPADLRKLRLFCAGRLDKDSEGLLVLTNDGALAERLTHPRHGVEKRYRVTLNRDFDPADIPRLVAGIEDEGDWLQVDKVVLPPRQTPESGRRLEVVLHHGKKREVRRLFAAHRYHVKKLKRVQFGGIVLRNLPRGAVRVLGRKEIERLLS